MKKLFLLTTSCLFVISAYCQTDFIPGYIVTVNNDTIHGFINNKNGTSNAHDCYFKNDEKAKQVAYKPSEINSYRFDNGRYYISNRLLNYKEDVFLEYLLKGKVSLYSYPGSNQTIFLAKKDSVLIELNHKIDTIKNQDKPNYIRASNIYKGQLRVLMGDAPQLINRFDRTPYGSKDLIKLSKTYHTLTCKSGEKCFEYVQEKRELTIKVGIMAAMGSPTLYAANEIFSPYKISKSDFSGSRSFSAGAFVDMQMDLISRRFALQIGASYLNYNFKSKTTSANYYYTFNDKIALTIDGIKIPLGLKYTFSNIHWRVYPFLQAEGWRAFFINTTSQIDHHITDNGYGTNESYSYNNFYFGSSQTGFALSGGIVIPIGSGKICLSTKYERGGGIHKDNTNPSDYFRKLTSVKGFNFQIAYIF